jgi:hypothetical protein
MDRSLSRPGCSVPARCGLWGLLEARIAEIATVVFLTGFLIARARRRRSIVTDASSSEPQPRDHYMAAR